MSDPLANLPPLISELIGGPLDGKRLESKYAEPVIVQPDSSSHAKLIYRRSPIIRGDHRCYFWEGYDVDRID